MKPRLGALVVLGLVALAPPAGAAGSSSSAGSVSPPPVVRTAPRASSSGGGASSSSRSSTRESRSGIAAWDAPPSKEPSRTRPSRRSYSRPSGPPPGALLDGNWEMHRIVYASYNQGLRLTEKGDEAVRRGVASRDPEVRDQLREVARAAYRRAEGELEDAVAGDPTMHEAWNQLGYARRRLGKLDEALEAYDQALALRPGYGPAIEYRGEVYLRMHRLDDAVAAHAQLARSEPALAARLAETMAKFVRARRRDPSGLETARLDHFEAWLQDAAGGR